MTIPDLIEQLAEIGATVRVDGDQVAVHFPEERRRHVEQLGPEIQRLKPELLKALSDAGSDTLPDGFESRWDGERELKSKPPSLEEMRASRLPGVKLVSYHPKPVPFPVAPVSIVTDAGKFYRAYLKDLAWRIEHREGHADPPLSDILAKLAEAGLQLTVNGL
jgi:hypothetical protein